jgi:hypothetical protein
MSYADPEGRRIARASNLVFFVLPLRSAERWIIELASQIFARRDDIEIETPVAVVMMNVAHATVLHRSKPEAGL